MLAVLLLPVSGCVSENLDTGDTNVDLLIAVEYKKAECGSAPALPLFVVDEVEKNALAGCVIAILSEPCPMEQYPLLCIRLYGQNVPGSVDLQDAFVP